MRMRKNKLPFCHAKTIYELPIDFFKKLKVKYLLVDLDNTLDSYKTKIPSKKAIALKHNLDSEGIELIIISNNRGKRVSRYANALHVRFLSGARKPFSFKLRKFILINKINKDETMMIGDQLLTDVKCGIGAGLRVILVDKLVKEDQWTTRFNRLLDNPKRRRLLKKGYLRSWRSVYEQN